MVPLFVQHVPCHVASLEHHIGIPTSTKCKTLMYPRLIRQRGSIGERIIDGVELCSQLSFYTCGKRRLISSNIVAAISNTTYNSLAKTWVHWCTRSLGIERGGHTQRTFL